MLDIMMPEIDGLQVLQRIKKTQRYKDTPVIMVSSMADSDVMESCYALGADDYITKPYRAPVLKTRLVSALSARREYITKMAHQAHLEKLASLGRDINNKPSN